MAHRIRASMADLRRMLANQEFRAVVVEASLSNEDAQWSAVVGFSNDREDLELEVVGVEATLFALRLHTKRNAKGGKALLPFVNSNDYWVQLETLAKDSKQKLQEALKGLTTGSIKFDCSFMKLVSEFLTSGRWHDGQFKKLKDNYFVIQAASLLIVKDRQHSQERMFKNKPGTRAYTKQIEDILNSGYGSAEGPVDSYLSFKRSMPGDTDAMIMRAWRQYELAEDLRNRLAIQGSVPGEIGVPHLMDNYRRLSEALVPFVRVVSDGICLLEGRERPQAGMGFTKRCQIIKKSKYHDLLRCLDPMIRASESHAGTEVHKNTGTVILADWSTGVPRVTGEYTFRAIVDMTCELVENLFPAMLISVCLHELYLLTLVLHSQDYLDLVLCVDNVEKQMSSGRGRTCGSGRAPTRGTSAS